MRIRVYVGALCLGLSLLLSTSVCSAQTYYRITEEELSRLENNLNRLEILNIRSQKNLVVLQDKLQKSQKQSAELENRLQSLKQTSEKQEQLLANANQSLLEFEKEEKRTKRRLERQRNIWIIIASAALAWGVERSL